MKIAVIGVKGIPTNQGEIERYCQEFYPRIAARGHQVDLFVQPTPDQQPLFTIGYYHKVRVIALAPLPLKSTGFMLSSALSTVCATLGGYDVIHIQGIKAAWFSWFPQLFSGSKIVVTSHQLDLDLERNKRSKIFGWLLSLMEKAAVKNADEVVVLSKALGKHFREKYNIRPHYIPNAPVISAQSDLQFSYGRSLGLEPQKYILHLGKLSPENQLHLLIAAFKKIEHQGWKLVLAGGSGDSVQYAVKLLSLAKSNPNIIFSNEIRGKHLAEVIDNAGLLGVPTDGSDLGLPLVVLEAMQKRIPVLASDRQVYRELIGQERGLLFESGNLNSLKEKLQHALSHPDVLMTMTQKAYTYITIHHNWDRATYGNLSLYLKVTEKVNPSPIQNNI